MASPQYYEGGEVQDFVRDVRVGADIVDPVLLRHATRTALRYAFNADDYPFVKTRREDPDSSRIVRVGIFSPLLYSRVDETIISNRKEVNRSSSFVQATKALFKASGIDFADAETGAEYVYVSVELDGTSISMHQDAINGSRSFLQLDGFKYLEFEPLGLTSPIIASVGLSLMPGDYYSMDFNPDEKKTIPHGVSYMGEPYCVSLYINHRTVE